jgi:hypothetical protein
MINRRDFLKATAAGAAASTFPRIALSQSVTLAAIKASDELKIGVEAAYVPFTYRQDGKIVGYDVELAEIFCKTLGVKPNLIDTAWAGVIPSLYAKKFDIIMSAMSYTKERVERVAFTIPYAEASQALLIRERLEQPRRGDQARLPGPDPAGAHQRRPQGGGRERLQGSAHLRRPSFGLCRAGAEPRRHRAQHDPDPCDGA